MKEREQRFADACVTMFGHRGPDWSVIEGRRVIKNATRTKLKVLQS